MAFFRRIGKIIACFIAVLIVGGIGGVLVDRILIPRMAGVQSFSKISFLKKATENTTIINKTEQIIVRDDDSVEKVSSQAATAVVTIVSTPHLDADAKKIGYGMAKQTFLAGSGVLVTNDGIVVTSRKAIVEKNSDYSVQLFNGASFRASMIGVDSFANLAYLKIGTDNVPAIAFANSSDIRPGRKLIALAASPQSYQNRFSTVLLNDIDYTFNLSEKTIGSSEKAEGVFIAQFPDQEDFVGGPVINYNGEMVGLVSFSELDGKRKYFLLPSNKVKNSLENALSQNLDQQPLFGAYYLSLTKSLSDGYRLSSDRGAFLFSPSGVSGLAVLNGSSAQKAGLLANDIVLSVNGEDITIEKPLSEVLSKMKKGDHLTLSVLRNDRTISLETDL